MIRNSALILALVCLAGATLSVQAKTNCDTLGVNFYDFIGCKRQSTGGDCPSYTDCKYEIPPGKCLYNGEVLGDGQNPSSDVLCNFGCICQAKNNSKGEFTCAQGQCGYWGYPVKEDCYQEYKLDKCCGTQKCDRSTVTCDAEGKSYKEGEKFYSKKECSVCVCTKDYNGKFDGPGCKRQVCDAEIRYANDIEKNCAPVYYKKVGEEALCCPLTFICPSAEDKIVSPEKPGSGPSCKYGDKTYDSSTVISRVIDQYGKKREVTCKCELPPLFTCTGDY